MVLRTVNLLKSLDFLTTAVLKWGDRWDSNPRQPESQSGALPTELRSPVILSNLKSDTKL